MQDPLDVLQNIEFKIIEVYRNDPSLLDIDAKDAVDALARHYHAEVEERRPAAANLSERAQRVFDAVKPVCEWRLGRTPMGGQAMEAMRVSELVGCLRRILKSIPRWSAQGGRQGYLKFVSQYVG